MPFRSGIRPDGLIPSVAGSATQTAPSCQSPLVTASAEEKATFWNSPQPMTGQHVGVGEALCSPPWDISKRAIPDTELLVEAEQVSLETVVAQLSLCWSFPPSLNFYRRWLTQGHPSSELLVGWPPSQNPPSRNLTVKKTTGSLLQVNCKHL